MLPSIDPKVCQGRICPTRTSSRVSDIFFLAEAILYHWICKYVWSPSRSWIHVSGVMEDESQDNKSISLSYLREALLSSSTKRRGTGLATLKQQIVQSGKRGEVWEQR